ncbi:Glycine cleavage T-protein [Rhodotorula toruloides ATCC 204091]|uniref:Glycine cleavage T-protein n=1 Tax=Rhodotorula toruloides TaxID=5286 RepID=A0A0K3CGC8_RHOTO|nr:Glycine cleavage T-protein [Rhodotorula toruloides ATCC 204091]KAK4335201.1 Glycine cleavage T-protein [Rhodotorula toruloides]PRQ74541.1 glycine cleavage T-protein [Rhodotorula toruloides]
MLLLSRTAHSPPASLRPCTCSFSRSFSLSARPLAPPYLYTQLTARALLAVSGQDSQKFLQGLVSNDVRRLAQKGEEDDPDKQRVLYANILKADGRYMHDIMLYSPLTPSADGIPAYLIEHDSSFTSTLRTYFKRHKLRSKVKLGAAAEEELVVAAAWRNPADIGEGKSTAQELEEAERWLEERKKGWDPRVVGMGRRWVEEKDGEKPPAELFAPVSPAHFQLHRLTHAVPEGPADFPALPLEANIDLMNGVDYRKGCYVGQELTARTHHKGIVRKRGMVFRLFREGEDVPTEPVPSSASLVPYPSLFPTPPPGSTLTLLSASSSPRARPSGKLGSSLPLVSQSGVQTITLAYGSVRTDQVGDGADPNEGVFVVKAPVSETATVGSEGEAKSEAVELGDGAGESQEEGGRWLAKAFLPAWLEFKLEEEAIAKGL